MGLSVQKDRVVTISVRMADMTGRILEETPPEGLTYIQGYGDIFPKLEAALEGRFAGEGFFIKLEPEEAFGEYDEESLIIVPITQFEDPMSVQVGRRFKAEELPESAEVDRPSPRPWFVTDVGDDMVVLEQNHPYAGIGLQFEIKVLSVRESTPEDFEEVESTSTEGIVPDFLKIADQIVSEDDDDVLDNTEALDHLCEGEDDSPMARMAKPPRILQ